MAEIRLVKDLFKPAIRVLEIGGGNGYQASVISSWGCQVHSIDLPETSAEPKRYYPVQEYDGKNIPFPNESFDLIFSSNVLEHVSALSSLLCEMRRVLKPDGIAVHLLPTPAWRFWTSATHYLFLLKYVLTGLPASEGRRTQPSMRQKLHERGLGFMLKRALFAGPHGTYPNALSELYFFSKSRWTRLFRKSGFEPLKITSNRLFYTGYGLFPGLSFETRRRLAHVLGSACHIFVLRKHSPESRFGS